MPKAMSVAGFDVMEMTVIWFCIGFLIGAAVIAVPFKAYRRRMCMLLQECVTEMEAHQTATKRVIDILLSETHRGN